MKKGIIKVCMLAVLAVCAVSMTSCFTYLVSKAATVTVKVMDGNNAMQGKVVYMFDHSRSDWHSYVKDNSSRQIATDQNGEAEFQIRELDLSLDDEKKGTFTFVVYNGDTPIGTKTVDVKSGDEKSVILHIGDVQ